MTMPAADFPSAIEVPGQGSLTPKARIDRPGYEIHIPGACLDVGSKLWTDEEKAHGIWLRMAYLTPTEEIEALTEAQRAGALVASSGFTVRKSIVAVASAGPVGEDGERPVGEWRRVPKLEINAFQKELGYQGRGIALMAFNLANATSEENRAAAAASFRVVG